MAPPTGTVESLMSPRGARVVLVLVTLLAGCSGATPTGTPSPTVTPAPVPSAEAAPAAVSTDVFDPETTYPIGPVEPTCPSGPAAEEQRYPAIRSLNVTVDGNWTDGTDAAVLAERAAIDTEFDPRAPLFPATNTHERVRLAGETFDPRERFDTDRFALIGAAENPAFHAIVLAPTNGTTRVVLYSVSGVC